MNMSYVLIHIIHKASVNHPQAAATSGPAHYRGHADSGAADKRIKDLARLSVLITYNTPINYTHTAATTAHLSITGQRLEMINASFLPFSILLSSFFL